MRFITSISLQVSRETFKKLVSHEYAQIDSLHAGEAYALQNLTRTDRLSLLLSGRAQVVSDRTTLHSIDANEFLDSPEFESSRASLEDKFRVSLTLKLTRKSFSKYQSLINLMNNYEFI